MFLNETPSAAPSTKDQDLPMFMGVPAGFPSPADDHMEGRLDIHALLVKRPAATFFCRANGASMTDAGINDGDLRVVDRSIEPHNGDVVVACIDGGLTVKRLHRNGAHWSLASANPDFSPVPINPEDGVLVWGVVTFAITPLCPR